ncbi:uncharacterized protein A4U43_C05F13120 [Asparagus officinalis]|uniref:THH1/TOM1/TOM3 domain-containing protein n=1 Tax=Asparagus officinalis TaxID=4686 RepID=A0A5P1EV08_ASPOF|nr:tobamovirus multiplication protein 1 [Asparagus officinalis]ONK68549.1 uncharacterized protein A4U43_C05F13120 [Asparagus officinalis]
MVMMMHWMVEARKGCLPTSLLVADALLSAVDGSIAALAFFQLLRIHFRNQQLGWTRQKIFHLMIGSSNIGYFLYFTSSLLATCQGWLFWLNVFGFILMACPQILFLAAFLLLLSFWVDLCHQAKDEEEDEEHGINESFLEKTTTKHGLLQHDGRRRCCSFRNIHVGSRQKFVILVIVLTFVLMITFALLIWSGRGKNPIDSSLMARVYQDIFSVAMLLLGGALACYGFLLSSKMSKVRSEMASTEMWKVASLAAVTLVCFTSCSILALVTNIPVLYYWHSDKSVSIICSVFIFLYYFIGSSIPSGFVLWIMREIPPPVVESRPSQSSVVTFVRDTTGAQNPQWKTAVASSQSKALRASPI